MGQSSCDDGVVQLQPVVLNGGRTDQTRLTIVGSPGGITPGVTEFTVFGKTVKR